jgi:hypothetical protein
VFDDVCNRHLGNQANILSARPRLISFWLELLPPLVKVDFLLSEAEGLAPLPERFDLHPEDILVELAGCLNINHGKDNVVNRLNHGVTSDGIVDTIVWVDKYMVNLDSTINMT